MHIHPRAAEAAVWAARAASAVPLAVIALNIHNGPVRTWALVEVAWMAYYLTVVVAAVQHKVRAKVHRCVDSGDGLAFARAICRGILASADRDALANGLLDSLLGWWFFFGPTTTSEDKESVNSRSSEGTRERAKQIPLANVREWVSWAFFDTRLQEMLSLSEIAEMNRIIAYFEAKLRFTFPHAPYNPQMKPIRLNIDPVQVSFKPLTFYVVIRTVDTCLDLALIYFHGFSRSQVKVPPSHSARGFLHSRQHHQICHYAVPSFQAALHHNNIGSSNHNINASHTSNHNHNHNHKNANGHHRHQDETQCKCSYNLTNSYNNCYCCDDRNSLRNLIRNSNLPINITSNNSVIINREMRNDRSLSLAGVLSHSNTNHQRIQPVRQEDTPTTAISSTSFSSTHSEEQSDPQSATNLLQIPINGNVNNNVNQRRRKFFNHHRRSSSTCSSVSTTSATVPNNNDNTTETLSPRATHPNSKFSLGTTVISANNRIKRLLSPLQRKDDHTGKQIDETSDYNNEGIVKSKKNIRNKKSTDIKSNGANKDLNIDEQFKSGTKLESNQKFIPDLTVSTTFTSTTITSSIMNSGNEKMNTTNEIKDDTFTARTTEITEDIEIDSNSKITEDTGSGSGKSSGITSPSILLNGIDDDFNQPQIKSKIEIRHNLFLLTLLFEFIYSKIEKFIAWLKGDQNTLFNQDNPMVLDFFYRPGNSTNNDPNNEEPNVLPLIFIHGVGLGVSHNINLLRSIPDDIPIFAIRMPQFTLRASHIDDPPSILAVCRAIEALLLSHGYSQGVFAGHSLGSTVIAWMVNYNRNMVASTIFLDPVCFLLYHYAVAKNFVYSSENKSWMDTLVKFFVAHDINLSHYLGRHFHWSCNTMLWNDMPRLPHSKNFVYLSERDCIVPVNKVAKYIIHGMIEDVLIDERDRIPNLTPSSSSILSSTTQQQQSKPKQWIDPKDPSKVYLELAPLNYDEDVHESEPKQTQIVPTTSSNLNLKSKSKASNSALDSAIAATLKSTSATTVSQSSSFMLSRDKLASSSSTSIDLLKYHTSGVGRDRKHSHSHVVHPPPPPSRLISEHRPTADQPTVSSSSILKNILNQHNSSNKKPRAMNIDHDGEDDQDEYSDIVDIATVPEPDENSFTGSGNRKSVRLMPSEDSSLRGMVDGVSSSTRPTIDENHEIGNGPCEFADGKWDSSSICTGSKIDDEDEVDSMAADREQVKEEDGESDKVKSLHETLNSINRHTQYGSSIAHHSGLSRRFIYGSSDASSETYKRLEDYDFDSHNFRRLPEIEQLFFESTNINRPKGKKHSSSTNNKDTSVRESAGSMTLRGTISNKNWPHDFTGTKSKDKNLVSDVHVEYYSQKTGETTKLEPSLSSAVNSNPDVVTRTPGDIIYVYRKDPCHLRGDTKMAFCYGREHGELMAAPSATKVAVDAITDACRALL